VSMTNSTFGFVSGNSVAQCAAHSEHPPVGGSVKFKNCFMSLPRKRGKIGFWLSGCPRPLGDVASFGDDTLSVRFVGLTNSGCFDLIRLVPTFNLYVYSFCYTKNMSEASGSLIENIQPGGRIGKFPGVLLFARRRDEMSALIKK